MKNETLALELLEELTGCLNLKVFINERSFIKKDLLEKIENEKLTNLLSGNIQVESLDERELYHLTKTLFKLIQDEKFFKKLTKKQQELKEVLDPANYFNQQEITEYDFSRLPKQNKNNYNTIVLDDVRKIIDGYYTVVIDMKTVLKWYRAGRLIYDYNCQRETEKVEYRGEYFEKAKIYSNSIHKMSKLMAEGRFFPNALAFNVPSNGEENFIYDKTSKRIEIKFDAHTILNLVDGFHRIMAGLLAEKICNSENKPFNQMMELKIMNFDAGKARDYIYQEGQKNAIDPQWMKSLKYDLNNSLAHFLNSGSELDNFMSNKIGRELKDVKLLGKLTTINIIANGFKDYFSKFLDEKDIRTIRRVKKYIVDYFNCILSFHKDYRINVIKSRKKTYALSHNTFIGYMYLASKLYNIDDWEYKIMDILDDINFDKNGEMKQFHLSKDIMNKREINDFIEYLNNVLERNGVNIRNAS